MCSSWYRIAAGDGKAAMACFNMPAPEMMLHQGCYSSYGPDESEKMRSIATFIGFPTYLNALTFFVFVIEVFVPGTNVEAMADFSHSLRSSGPHRLEAVVTFGSSGHWGEARHSLSRRKFDHSMSPAKRI